MLDISRIASDDKRVTYALRGEITVDQMERFDSLISAARQRGRSVAFDLQRVWRVDRAAAVLIARHACRPNNQVRVVGLPMGLLEWLRAVSNEHP